jgi:hypothetical protein
LNVERPAVSFGRNCGPLAALMADLSAAPLVLYLWAFAYPTDTPLAALTLPVVPYGVLGAAFYPAVKFSVVFAALDAAGWPATEAGAEVESGAASAPRAPTTRSSKENR